MNNQTTQLVILTTLALVVIFLLVGCGGSRAQYSNHPREAYLYIIHQFTTKECTEKTCEEVKYVKGGSGFVVAAENGISWGITAGHVCTTPKDKEGSSEISVVSHGGIVYPAKSHKIMHTVDLCVLLIRGVHLKRAEVSPHPPIAGERVYAYASPIGIYDSHLVPKFEGFYAGHTTNVSKPGDPSKSFAILAGYTIPARPGSSGGPIFNSRGQIVGVIIMSRNHIETFSLSPTYNAVKALMAAVRAYAVRTK